MLNGISPLVEGDLLKLLSDMGHGDELLIADANFPASRYAERVVRNMGSTSVEMLDAVLSLFPLDHLEQPVYLMSLSPGDSEMARPSIWDEFKNTLEAYNYVNCLDWIAYKEFYTRANDCYAIVQTGETALYGNILLRKGVVLPDGR